MATPPKTQQHGGTEPLTYPYYCDSKPFTFIFGPEKAEFTIHSALVAHQSPKLRALVYGGMKESIELKVEWLDTDPTTFRRFGSWSYSGDYDEDEPTPRRSLDDGGESSRSAKTGESCVKLQPRSHMSFWQAFSNLPFTVYLPEQAMVETMTYTDTLICSAKVYVFADYHQIEGLKDLSFGVLYGRLHEFPLNEYTCHDFIKLAGYVLQHASDQCFQLRHLVTHYAACHFEILNKKKEFRMLLTPEFAGSLLDLVAHRIELDTKHSA